MCFCIALALTDFINYTYLHWYDTVCLHNKTIGFRYLYVNFNHNNIQPYIERRVRSMRYVYVCMSASTAYPWIHQLTDFDPYGNHGVTKCNLCPKMHTAGARCHFNRFETSRT